MSAEARGRWTAGLGAFALAWLCAWAAPAAALDNGLARTPPMGWNPWYRFHCAVNERLVRQTADAMVSSGMRLRGYHYVNLDDCWMAASRDPGGALQADPVKFPNGIAGLAGYVHHRGLKLGIYASAGGATCAGFPGSRDHLEQDAATFAAWGVDYVKLDWCYPARDQRPPVTYAAMRDALRRTGRPMVLSISEHGRSAPWVWGPRTGNLWRTTHDFTYGANPARPWERLLAVVDRNQRVGAAARTGGWNDPDILQVGNRRLTATEGRTLFSLWSMMAAPLIAGNDLRAMSTVTRRTLTNRQVIAVDQDRAGVRALRRSSATGREVWVRRLASGQRALVLFNRRSARALLGADARGLGLGRAPRYVVRDLWTGRAATTSGPIRAWVPRHGVAMFRVARIGR